MLASWWPEVDPVGKVFRQSSVHGNLIRLTAPVFRVINDTACLNNLIS